MSSSPPTEISRRAGWRHPAAWPLRTRLVALMIVLLSLLGILVGATTEIFLSERLYKQLDSTLHDVQQRSGPFLKHMNDLSNPRFGGGGGPPGMQDRTIVLQLTASGAQGGIVREV